MDQRYEYSLEVYCRDAETVDAVEEAYRTRRVQDDELVILVLLCCTREAVLATIAQLEAIPGVSDVVCDCDVDASMEEPWSWS